MKDQFHSKPRIMDNPSVDVPVQMRVVSMDEYNITLKNGHGPMTLRLSKVYCEPGVSPGMTVEYEEGSRRDMGAIYKMNGASAN